MGKDGQQEGVRSVERPKDSPPPFPLPALNPTTTLPGDSSLCLQGLLSQITHLHQPASLPCCQQRHRFKETGLDPHLYRDTVLTG